MENKVEKIRKALKAHPNIQALARQCGVSAQALYLIRRGERVEPKPATLRMIERGLNERPGDEFPPFSNRTARLVDLIRTHGGVKTDSAAVSLILAAAQELSPE